MAIRRFFKTHKNKNNKFSKYVLTVWTIYAMISRSSDKDAKNWIFAARLIIQSEHDMYGVEYYYA